MKHIDSVSHFNTGYHTSARPSFGDAVVMRQLVKGLASVYRDVLEEPLPERLSALLRQVGETLQRTKAA